MITKTGFGFRVSGFKLKKTGSAYMGVFNPKLET